MLPPFSKRPSSRRSGSIGFTLVEVTVALAMVIFTVTALLGVVPLALNTYRDALDSSLRAHIVRKIAAELEQAPFDQVRADAGVLAGERHFGDQGLEVAAEDALFRVRYEVEDSTALLGSTNRALRPVTLRIFHAGGEAEARPLATVTVFVSDNGLRMPHSPTVADR